MEMPVSHAVFATTPPTEARADLFALATLWRGAMLECFARMERAIAETLNELHKCGMELPADARHQAVVTRARALAEVSRRPDFGGHGLPTVRKLEAYVESAGERNAMAHGTLEIRGPKAVFVVASFHDGQWEDSDLGYSPVEMLVRLEERHAMQRALASQLGQLRRAARLQHARPQPL